MERCVLMWYSLGMQMVKSYKNTRRVVIAGAVCSAMVPLGVIVGLVMTETGHQQNHAILVANGILQVNEQAQ